MRKAWKSLIILPLLCGCNTPRIEVYTRSVLAFSTVVSIQVYGHHKEVVDELAAEALKYSKALDRYDESSDLYRLNHTNDPIEVDYILADCLVGYAEFAEQLNGYFSIYLGKLKDAYLNAFKNNEIPSDSQLNELLSEANQTTLEIKKNTVQRFGAGEIDLGGLAKGYFLKEAKILLEEAGATEYVINLGSSSILFGESPIQGERYSVIPEEHPDLTFPLSCSSLSTSSIYKQSYKIGENTYTHVIHPKNGSAIARHDMVTFVGDDPFFLDAATTAAMNMEIEEIEALGLDGFVIDGEEAVYHHGLD